MRWRRRRLHRREREVTVNPDSSATLAPEEWAKLSGLIGGPSAPHPRAASSQAARRAPTTPAAAVARTSDRWRRGCPAQSAATGASRASREAKVVVHDDPDTLSDLLKEDELAAILGAIGLTEESKATACSDAQAWCALNKEHKAVCDSHPRVWQSLTKRIFDPATVVDDEEHRLVFIDDKEVAMGKRLIYDTFKDDAHPQKAFLSMCGATGLADVLEKRFVMLASERYGEMLWDVWADVRADITGLGEEIEDMDGGGEQGGGGELPRHLQGGRFGSRSQGHFDRAPPSASTLMKYHNDRAFGKLVDNLFNGTIHYLCIPGQRQRHAADANRSTRS